MSKGYYYVETQPGVVWTTYCDDSDGNSHCDKDWDSQDAAAARVAYLNGGGAGSDKDITWKFRMHCFAAAMDVADLDTLMNELDAKGWGEMGTAMRSDYQRLMRESLGQWRAKLEAVATALGMEQPEACLQRFDVSGWSEYAAFIRGALNEARSERVCGPVYQLGEADPEPGKKYLCWVQIAKDLALPQVCEVQHGEWMGMSGGVPHVVRFAEILEA